MASWRCWSCGGSIRAVERPRWCARCQAANSFVHLVRSPAAAPPAKRPVRASELGGGVYAAPLGRGWDARLGRLGRPVRILVWGAPGTKKTTHGLDICEGFQSWGDVLFAAVDEGCESVSFLEKVARLEVRHTFVMSGGWGEVALEAATGRWALIALDTANRLGVVPAELDDYTRSVRTSWLVILEATKAAQFKGDASWGHWADIILHAQRGALVPEKNRYAPLTTEERDAAR